MPDSRYACIIFDLAKIVLDSEEWEDAVWSLKFLISCGYKIKISLAIGSLDMRDFEPVELISPDGVILRPSMGGFASEAARKRWLNSKRPLIDFAIQFPLKESDSSEFRWRLFCRKARNID